MQTANTLLRGGQAGALRIGMTVMWSPDANPGMGEDMANDRGRILAITPFEATDNRRIDMVTVLWDSVVKVADPDRPCSHYGTPVASTRIRRVFYGTEVI